MGFIKKKFRGYIQFEVETVGMTFKLPLLTVQQLGNLEVPQPTKVLGGSITKLVLVSLQSRQTNYVSFM
jgi:hypothetical protein